MTENNSGLPKKQNWVAITAGVLGGVLLLGTVSTAAMAGVFAATDDGKEKSQRLFEDAAGVTRIEVDASAAKFVISCDSAGALGDDESSTGQDTFALLTSGGSREWRMVRHGDTLRVEPVDRGFGLSLFGLDQYRMQNVSLAVPQSACERATPLDAELGLGAGQLQVDGRFGELSLEVGAGDARVTGEVRSLSADVSAGGATLNLSGVRTASLSVSAGDLWGDFDGAAPERIDVEVSAGSAELTLPDEVYAVTSDVSAGDLENSLRTDNGVTANTIRVEISAGSLALHPRR